MKKRDYEDIADIIRKLPVKQRNSVAQHFATELKKARAVFKTEIFLKAAGFKPKDGEA